MSALAALVLVSGCGSATTPAGVTLDLDWQTCSLSQWRGTGGEEVGNPGQITLVTRPRRTASGCAARFEVSNDPRDIWEHHSFRSLLARYDSQDGWGANRDVTYAFSFRFPIEQGQTGRPGYALLWELHHRRDLYAVAPALAVAPHAIELLPDGRLVYRLAGGAAVWNGSAWTGWSTWRPDNTLVAHVRTGTWYDVVVHLRLSEHSDGRTQVYVRRAGEAWPAVPTWQASGANLPWIPGGLDPAVPRTRSSASPDPSSGYTGLYVCVGLYPGGTTWAPDQSTQQIIVYVDDLRRYTGVAPAEAALPRS